MGKLFGIVLFFTEGEDFLQHGCSLSGRSFSTGRGLCRPPNCLTAATLHCSVVTVMWSRVEAWLGIRKPEQGPPCLTNNIPNVLQQARDPTKQMICIRHCPKYITTEPAIYKQGTSTCIRPKIQFLTVPSPVGIEECCLFEIEANLTNVCFVLR